MLGALLPREECEAGGDRRPRRRQWRYLGEAESCAYGGACALYLFMRDDWRGAGIENVSAGILATAVVSIARHRVLPRIHHSRNCCLLK